MKKTILMVGFLSGFVALVTAGCTVTTDTGNSGTCEAVSCADALASGLQVQGDALCDAVSDNAYADVFDCACTTVNGPAGFCDAECGDNLCQDLGESSDCGDCLNANCNSEHTTCAND